MVLTMVLYELSRCLFSGVSSKGVVRRAFFFFFDSYTPESHLLAFTKKHISDIRLWKGKEKKGGRGIPRDNSLQII